jgi:hypothetical protein
MVICQGRSAEMGYFLIKDNLVFYWNVVWCGSKNGYQKNMCLKEIGLCAQSMIIIQLLKVKT